MIMIALLTIVVVLEGIAIMATIIALRRTRATVVDLVHLTSKILDVTGALGDIIQKSVLAGANLAADQAPKRSNLN